MKTKRRKKYNKKSYRKKSYNKKNLNKKRFINSYRKNYITKGGNEPDRAPYESKHGQEFYNEVMKLMRRQDSTSITQKTVKSFFEKKIFESFFNAYKAIKNIEIYDITILEKDKIDSINNIKKNILELCHNENYDHEMIQSLEKKLESLNNLVTELNNLISEKTSDIQPPPPTQPRVYYPSGYAISTSIQRSS